MKITAKTRGRLKKRLFSDDPRSFFRQQA